MTSSIHRTPSSVGVSISSVETDGRPDPVHSVETLSHGVVGLTQAFGVRGQMGDLALFPKLVLEQFDSEGKASVKTWFADRRLHVTYLNPDRLEYDSYKVVRVRLNEQELHLDSSSDGCLIPRKIIAALDPNQNHEITAWLAVH